MSSPQFDRFVDTINDFSKELGIDPTSLLKEIKAEQIENEEELYEKLLEVQEDLKYSYTSQDAYRDYKNQEINSMKYTN